MICDVEAALIVSRLLLFTIINENSFCEFKRNTSRIYTIIFQPSERLAFDMVSCDFNFGFRNVFRLVDNVK